MTVEFTNAASNEVVTINGVDYRIVTWTENGSLTVTGALDVEYLVVGGGGQGGRGTARPSGGGGAGGLLTNVDGSPLTLSGSVTVEVGAGGFYTGTSDRGPGGTGSPSKISFGETTIEALGGGGGGGSNTSTAFSGTSGGSGGGGGSPGSGSLVTPGGAGTAGQGNDGGDGEQAGSTRAAGGGGGAGEPGGTAILTPTLTNGKGGDGVQNSITGTAVWYAGGGGGGGAAGGLGGGGTDGGAGVDGLGGGAGGVRSVTTNRPAAEKGGDGIVIIRYDISQEMIGSGDETGSGDELGSGSGDEIGSGSGSGDIPTEPAELPTSSIEGQFTIQSTVRLDELSFIDASFGIAAFVGLPSIFTEGDDGTTPTEIVEDIPDSGSPGVSPTPPVGTQPQIVDRRWAAAPPRRTVIVDLEGVPQDNGFLSTAAHGDITWTRSTPSQWTVSLPVNSSEAQEFLQPSRVGTFTPFKELQLWRGRQLLVWGPVTNLAVNGDTLTLTGADVSWYMGRRFIGPIENSNLLPEPRLLPGLQGWFRSVFRGWDNTFTSNSADINVTGARLPRNPEQFAIRIEDRNPIYNNDPDWNGFVSFPSAFQILTIPRQQVPTSLEFSCLIEIERLISRNDESSAIGIGLFPTNARGLRDLIDVAWAQVGDDFPVRKRERLSVSMDIPANRNTYVVLMVRGPKGVSYLWDFNLAWSGGLISVNTDRSQIIRKVVDHVSGNPNTRFRDAREHPFRPFAGPTDYGKNDAKIRVSALRSRTRIDRVYPFDQSTVGLSALTELTELDDNWGWRIVTSDTQRTFTTSRVSTPRWECALRYTPAGGNIFDFQWQYLGEQAANNVAVLSSQNSGRSGGGRTGFISDDPRDRNWAVSLEDVSSAPEEIQDDELERFAFTRWSTVSEPVALQIETSAVPLFTRHRIQPGDIVPVTIRHGELNITGVYRIYSMTLKADDTLSLTMTPKPGVSALSLL